MPDTKPDMNAVQGKLMDMIVADESPSTISDTIKDMLFAKTSDRVDGYRPNIASKTFDPPQETPETPSAEVEDNVEAESQGV
jgi:hypothetical protein